MGVSAHSSLDCLKAARRAPKQAVATNFEQRGCWYKEVRHYTTGRAVCGWAGVLGRVGSLFVGYSRGWAEPCRITACNSGPPCSSSRAILYPPHSCGAPAPAVRAPPPLNLVKKYSPQPPLASHPGLGQANLRLRVGGEEDLEAPIQQEPLHLVSAHPAPHAVRRLHQHKRHACGGAGGSGRWLAKATCCLGRSWATPATSAQGPAAGCHRRVAGGAPPHCRHSLAQAWWNDHGRRCLVASSCNTREAHCRKGTAAGSCRPGCLPVCCLGRVPAFCSCTAQLRPAMPAPTTTTSVDCAAAGRRATRRQLRSGRPVAGRRVKGAAT